MKQFLIASILVVLLAACNDDGNTPPVSTEKMGQILTDIQLAEVYSSMVDDSLHRVMPKNQDSLAVYYKEIFAHHQVTQEEFQKAMDWYKSNPEMLDSAYKVMINELTVKEGFHQPVQEN
jgi:hypothetical protein